jgi:putative transposase
MEVRRVVTVNLRTITAEQQTVFHHLTYCAAKLWNVMNYEVHSFPPVPIGKLDVLFKNHFFARNLHSQSAQAVAQKLGTAWKSYFALIKEYRKKKQQALANGQLFDDPVPGKPGYQPKDGHLSVKWKKQGFRLIDGKLRLSLSKQTREYLQQRHGIQSKFSWIALPKALSLGAAQLQEIELVPHDFYGQLVFVLHLIYRKTITPPSLVARKVMAIDLGVPNFATVVIEGARDGYIFDGRVLVSRFRWFNKERGKAVSIKERLANQQLPVDRPVQRLVTLTVKERSYTRDYIHKFSKWIVELAVMNCVSKIVIGGMSEGITQMDIGRKNNEKLHRFPFGRLFDFIKYKALEQGIEVEKVNEAYTSQTCSCCGLRRKANRVYRGLYRCKQCKSVINADDNAARNILFRVVPYLSPKTDRDSGLGNLERIRVTDSNPFGKEPPSMLGRGVVKSHL